MKINSKTYTFEIDCNQSQFWYSRSEAFKNDDSTNLDCKYYTGYYHRDGDLPAVTHSNGSQDWYCHGNLHRENEKPARFFISSGFGYLYLDGQYKGQIECE